MAKRSKLAANEVVYWEPAANIGQASSTSTPEEEEQAIYYKPPQTPQEAIEMGLVANKAEKPRNFLHHWERLGPSHKPKYWHCWWGCEGVQSVLDNPSVATHDYYCPYWQMLLLFPEWREDFWYTLMERPPMPEGGPPLVEEEFNAEKRRYSEAIAGRNREAESNPFNINAEQIGLNDSGTRIRVKRSNKNSRKESGNNGSRREVSGKKSTETRTENNADGWGFSEPKPKQKRRSKSS